MSLFLYAGIWHQFAAVKRHRQRKVREKAPSMIQSNVDDATFAFHNYIMIQYFFQDILLDDLLFFQFGCRLTTNPYPLPEAFSTSALFHTDYQIRTGPEHIN